MTAFSTSRAELNYLSFMNLPANVGGKLKSLEIVEHS